MDEQPWLDREDHPCLLGWLFVQGWFDSGAVLSWHVQRSSALNPGTLHWECWVWQQGTAVSSTTWRAYLLRTVDIDQPDRVKQWQIHEDGELMHKKNLKAPSKEHALK